MTIVPVRDRFSDLTQLASDERSKVERPLISLFLEVAHDKYPELREAINRIRTFEQRGNGYYEKGITQVFNDYAEKPEQLFKLVDLMAKINVSIGHVGYTVAFQNYLELVARPLRDDAYATAKRNRRSVTYHAKYIPNFSDRMFIAEVPRQNPDAPNKIKMRWTFRTSPQFTAAFARRRSTKTLTPHPTQLKSQAMRGKIRLLESTVEEVTQPLRARLLSQTEKLSKIEVPPQDEEKIKAVIGQILDVELTPENSDGTIRRATVLEEITDIRDAVRAARKSVKAAWHTIDRAAGRNLPDYDKRERLKFRLNQTYASWGSGDKDNHPGKKAELVLFEKTGLRQDAIAWALQELSEGGAAHLAYEPAERQALTATLQRAATELGAVMTAMLDVAAKHDNKDIPLTHNQLITLSDRVAKALQPDAQVIDTHAFEKFAKAIEKKLEDYYKKAPQDQEDRLLDAINELRNFSLYSALLEGRENEAELTTSIRPLVRGVAEYKDMPDHRRAAWLDNTLMKDRQFFMREANALLTRMGDSAATNRNYAHDDVLAYHNLMRMREQLITSDMRGGMVIAEYKGPVSFLEALALQAAFAPLDKSGLPHYADIMPLYEDFESLLQAPDDLIRLLEYKSVRQYLLAKAGSDPSKISLTYMLAHSDNTKNSGTFASRAALALTHQACQKKLDDNHAYVAHLFAQDGVSLSKGDIKLHFYEGRSPNHFNRGGGMPTQAMNDNYGTHHHSHETIQGAGIDALHCEILAKRQMTAESTSAAITLDRQQATGEGPKKWTALNYAVAKGFMRTEPNYKKEHYSPDSSRGIHYAYPGVSYEAYARVAVGSRPSARVGADETSRYAAEEGQSRPVKLTKIRAIPDVEMQYIGYVQATFLAAEHVETYLAEEIISDPKALKEFQQKANALAGHEVKIFADGALTKDGASALLHLDETYKEISGFVSYGLANTRFDILKEMLERGRDAFAIPIAPEHQAYLEKVFVDYEAAAKWVFKTFKMDMPDTSQANDFYEKGEIIRQALLKGPLASYAQEIEEGWRRAGPFLNRWADISMRAYKEEREYTPLELKELRTCVAAVQPLTHPHAAKANDPSYARSHRQWIGAGRPKLTRSRIRKRAPVAGRAAAIA